MKGEDKSLLKLMDGSENRFIIPVYQRNYDWGTSQCKQLFSDLIDIVKYKRPSHFFDAIRKLVVIDIFLGSDDDPQLIFESLCWQR